MFCRVVGAVWVRHGCHYVGYVWVYLIAVYDTD